MSFLKSTNQVNIKLEMYLSFRWIQRKAYFNEISFLVS